VVLKLIAFGMWSISAGTALQSLARLASDDVADAPVAGTVLAAMSLIVLGLRKAALGKAIPSPAPIADSHLTKFGAVLAFITLVGTATAATLGW
jgi:hypothetical protein